MLSSNVLLHPWAILYRVEKMPHLSNILIFIYYNYVSILHLWLNNIFHIELHSTICYEFSYWFYESMVFPMKEKNCLSIFLRNCYLVSFLTCQKTHAMQWCFLKERKFLHGYNCLFLSLVSFFTCLFSCFNWLVRHQNSWETVMQNTFFTRHYLSWKTQVANLVLMKFTRDLHRD